MQATRLGLGGEYHVHDAVMRLGKISNLIKVSPPQILFCSRIVINRYFCYCRLGMILDLALKYVHWRK